MNRPAFLISTTLAAMALAVGPTLSAQEAGPPPPPAPAMHGGGHAGHGGSGGPGSAPGHDHGAMGGPEGHLLPHGTWWRNADLVKAIGLAPDQQKRIDDTFLQSRVKLIDLHASLDKEQLLLEPLLSANPIDQGRAMAQIDKVADTRAMLEKEDARMLLSIRGVLTPDQWTKLQAMHPGGPERGGPDKGGPGFGPMGPRSGRGGGPGAPSPSGNGARGQGGNGAPPTPPNP